MTTTATKTKLTFSCPVDALLEATVKVLTVVPTRSPKPVLANIHFATRDGVLELSGTDFTAGIHYQIPAAEITEDGEGLLNGARFAELLKEFRGVDAKLSFNQRGGCQFRAKGGRYKVVGDDVRDYPKGKRFEDQDGIPIVGKDLVEMIKKTSFAAAPEESRLTMNGVLFDCEDERVRLVATDNKRMAISQLKVEPISAPFRVSAPRAFLGAVLKVLSKDVADKEAVLGTTDTKIFLRLPGVTVYSTTLQGDYPPYDEGLRIELSHSIDCSVKDLLGTIRRAMLVNPGLSAFVFETGSLTLKGVLAAYGDGNAFMETNLLLPEDVERVRIGFNPAYFRDALEVMTEQRCRFYFQGPRNAGVLKELVTETAGEEAVEQVSTKFSYAVMPALLPRGV